MRLLLPLVLMGIVIFPHVPGNLDFETGTLGQVPAGWRTAAGGGTGFRAALAGRQCSNGRGCAVLGAAAPLDRAGGVLYKVVPAEPHRSRRVRIRAAVRVEGSGARVRLCLRTERTGGGAVYETSPEISASGWSYYELESDVPADGERILFGFQLSGSGKGWVDDVSLVDVEKSAPKATSPSRRRPARLIA